MTEPVAHICLFIDGIGEIHLDIINETDDPILDVVGRAFEQLMVQIKETVNADPRPAPIE